jgi:hypothetical protein
MTRWITGSATALTIALFGLAGSAQAADRCFYKGAMYSEGATACQAGKEYRCDEGEWEKLGRECVTAKIAPAKVCDFEGIAFSTGSASCQDGMLFRCEDGSWESLGDACPASHEPARLGSDGKTCMYEGATVSHRSAICRAGETFFCNDGEWVNLGTRCR